MNFLKIIFIPSKKNNFCPLIISLDALVLYAIICASIFLISFNYLNISADLMATLTQGFILEEINPIREERGFLLLRLNDKLTLAAQNKADDMINRSYFSHTGPNGELPWQWIDSIGYNYAIAAENLAIDCANPKSLVNAWINSPSHAKNILNGYFRDVGIGVAKGNVEGRNTTIVVMFLGREIDQEIQASLAVVGDIENKEINKPENFLIQEEKYLNKINAEEFIIDKKVDEDILYKENVFLSTQNDSFENLSFEESKPDIRILFSNNIFINSKIIMTVFLSLLFFWTIITLFIFRIGIMPRITSSIILSSLIAFLWIPL